MQLRCSAPPWGCRTPDDGVKTRVTCGTFRSRPEALQGHCLYLCIPALASLIFSSARTGMQPSQHNKPSLGTPSTRALSNKQSRALLLIAVLCYPASANIAVRPRGTCACRDASWRHIPASRRERWVDYSRYLRCFCGEGVDVSCEFLFAVVASPSSAAML
jgi:hypothetical protein